MIFKSSLYTKHSSLVVFVLFLISISCLTYGGYLVIHSPTDYQQGHDIKLMYLHVPFCWISLLGYSFIAFCSIATFVWKNPIIFISSSQAAKFGTLFCFMALFTGMIWGKSTWNTYWVWDARITSTFCLFVTYITYLIISDTQKHNPNRDKILAIIGLVGAINIPIIKFSVEYWNTLHQPSSIFRKGGIAIDPQFLHPLLWMTSGITFTYILLIYLGTSIEIIEIKMKNLDHGIRRNR